MVDLPFLVSYSITNKCNLKCKHCYSDSLNQPAPDELSTEEAKIMLDVLAKWGVKLLILDGGEPLCRDDFFEIVKYASDRHLRVVVGSNGTLLNKQVAVKMLELGIQTVAISIDGAHPETHDSFRGKDGAFEKAMGAVKVCRDVGFPFQFNTVIRRRTIPEVHEILQLAIGSGANAVEFFDLVQVNRVKRECYNDILTLRERMNVMEWLAEAQINCPIIIRVPACPMYPIILKEKNSQPKHFSVDMLRRIPYYERGCAAGMPNGYLTILPNGDLIPCMLLQIKLDNAREKHIIKVWEESPILANLRRRDLLEGKCGKCVHRDFCARCRGRAFEETGNMMGSDIGCWFKEDHLGDLNPFDQEITS